MNKDLILAVRLITRGCGWERRKNVEIDTARQLAMPSGLTDGYEVLVSACAHIIYHNTSQSQITKELNENLTI